MKHVLSQFDLEILSTTYKSLIVGHSKAFLTPKSPNGIELNHLRSFKEVTKCPKRKKKSYPTFLKDRSMV